jgi:hypothetical protein
MYFWRNLLNKAFFSYIFLFSFASISQEIAPDKNTKKISIPHMHGEITVDATLDESQWKKAKKVEMNIVTRPYDNTKSPVDTHALMIENGETLFIAFIAEDPTPKEMRAYLKDRDKSWGDDLVGIKLDTYNDQRTAYRFLSNPLGVQIDGIESEVTKKESDSWDGIWRSAGKITDQGYVVEMALPFRMLNFDENKKIQDWGIELMRFYPRSQFLRLSNISLDRGNSCELCQLATATGFEGAKQGSNLMITPALVTSVTQEKDEDDIENSDWQKDTSIEPSLDIRWGITPDLLLNATINPDFSTVETDGARLNINNNFALFFDEKRPFFLDNQDYFDSNYNLVYTRNINAPNYGAKLTGRHKQHSFGLFLTDDADTNILIPGNRASTIATIEAESKAAALRYRNNFNDDITLGWLSTLRTSDNYENSVHGIDARMRLSTEDVVKFQGLYSKTQYPDDLFEQFCDSDNIDDCNAPDDDESCDLSQCEYNEPLLRTLNSEPFTGNAFKAGYYHTDSAWHYFGKYERQNQGFRGDLGFISRVDFNKAAIGGSRKWYAEQNEWWTEFKIYSDWDISHNDKGELIEEEFDISAHLNANYDSYIRLSYSTRDKVGSRIDKSSLAIDGNTTLFNENSISLFAEINPILGLQLKTHLSYGDAIDYSNNRLGKNQSFTPTINWNINKNLEIKLKHTFRRLDADNPNIKSDKVFIARLTDLRTTYQFNVLSFLRFSVIYNNTHRNPENYLYSDPQDINSVSKGLATELLYAYKINPQTVFYLGYSDNHESEDSFSNLKQDTRNAFMKFSYAWIK